MNISRANQGWGMEITYIPMARGFVYLEFFTLFLPAIHLKLLIILL